MDLSSAPSPGLMPLLESIHRLSGDFKSPRWTTVCINLNTLLRNNLTKEISDKQCYEAASSDGDHIVDAILQYWKSFPASGARKDVIVFVPDYSALPVLYRRESSKTTVQIRNIPPKFIPKLYPNGKAVGEPVVQGLPDGGTFTLMRAGDARHYPHRVLHDYIVELHSEGKKKLLSRSLDISIGMVSHHALDWHIGFLVKSFHLLESYTGTIRTFATLGEKLFKDKAIPFNRATHVLFGDSTEVRAMAQRKNKQIITDVAHKKRWFATSESGIISDITNALAVPSPLITNVKF